MTIKAETTATQSAPQPDLSGFLIAHAGMRQEFGLLGATAREPMDAERRRLWESQVALVLDVLHHHHTAEDDTLWPMLRARAPEAIPTLDRLQADPARIDPMLAGAADTRRPLAERADLLDGLHLLLNTHLDLEESVAVPLIREHVTIEEWEALGERAVRDMGRRRIPTIYGWYASAGSAEQVAAALASVPAVARVLFRLFWWPAYQRRARRLYGREITLAVAPCPAGGCCSAASRATGISSRCCRSRRRCVSGVTRLPSRPAPTWSRECEPSATGRSRPG